MKRYLAARIKGFKRIEKIRGEASARDFFRIFYDKYSLIAMVYPEESEDEIGKVVQMASVYKKGGVSTPEIKEVINNRIILQSDLGDLLVQKAFSIYSREEKREVLNKVVDLIIKLKQIPVKPIFSTLDKKRMKWEMDFFLKHFVQHFSPPSINIKDLSKKLVSLVDGIKNIKTFAHRDFHSRNMLVFKKDIYLVDFQDSLVAPEYYDIVSFVFDSYLDLGMLRDFFLNRLEKAGIKIDPQQFNLTALQRNIKALGTFGFQINVKKNLSYKKYIKRTVRYILNNKLSDEMINRSVFNHFDI